MGLAGDIAHTDSAASAVECGGEDTAGYLAQESAQLYYVLHMPVGSPIGRMLLAGPLGTDRSNTYLGWVAWARYLASQGFEVMRFDYRGMGESTGQFEEVAFEAWLKDLLLCAQWLGNRGVSLPLTLHGLGMGTLLAAKAYAQGVGDGLLLWSPPNSARELLMGLLRRRLASDLAAGEGRGVTRNEYIAQMEAGQTIEVDGYAWSQRLWREAADLPLILPRAEGAGSEAGRARCCRVEQLDGRGGRPPMAALNWPMLAAGDAWARTTGAGRPSGPAATFDLSEFFAVQAGWVRSEIRAGRSGENGESGMVSGAYAVSGGGQRS